MFKETAGSPTDLLPSDMGITRLDKFPENSASGSMTNNQREVLFTVQMTHNFYICERLNKSIHCHVLSTLFCWIQIIYSPFLSQVCMKSTKQERQVFKAMFLHPSQHHQSNSYIRVFRKVNPADDV